MKRIKSMSWAEERRRRNDVYICVQGYSFSSSLLFGQWCRLSDEISDVTTHKHITCQTYSLIRSTKDSRSRAVNLENEEENFSPESVEHSSLFSLPFDRSRRSKTKQFNYWSIIEFDIDLLMKISLSWLITSINRLAFFVPERKPVFVLLLSFPFFFCSIEQIFDESMCYSSGSFALLSTHSGKLNSFAFERSEAKEIR